MMVTNVTADDSPVLLLSRWKAADLFLKDIQVLVSELSMTEATPELRALAGGMTLTSLIAKSRKIYVANYFRR